MLNKSFNYSSQCDFRIPHADNLSIKNLKIGIPKEYACEYLDDEVLQTWNEITTFLENSGAIITEVEIMSDNHQLELNQSLFRLKCHILN